MQSRAIIVLCTESVQQADEVEHDGDHAEGNAGADLSHDEDGQETAYNNELEALAATLENLAEDLPVGDLADLSELSNQMYEGLATMKDAHARLRAKASNRSYRPQSLHPSVSSLD